MKNLAITSRILFLSVLMLVFAPACTDLDEELFNQVTPDTFFETDAQVASALGAAYTNLSQLGNNNTLMPMQGITADELVVPTRGTDWDDGGNWRRLHLHEYVDTDDRIIATWNFCFGGINTCNRLIFQFESLGGDQTAAISELRALRAMYYYWLLDMYGNVPIVTRFDVPADFAPATNSRAEVYDFVVSEINAVLPNLLTNTGGSAYGRVNRWTALAVLANTYLNAEVYTGTARWADAETAATDIINSGLFSLAGNYRDNFVTDNSGSPEFIFAIPFDEVFLQGFNLAQMTLHYVSQQTFNLQDQPWNGFSAMEEMYVSYIDPAQNPGPQGEVIGVEGTPVTGTQDVRLANFLVGPQFGSDGARLEDGSAGAVGPDPDGAPLTFTPRLNSLGAALRQDGARIGKWEFASGATPNLSNDLAVFRYADILLIKAEAMWRQGNVGGALPFVNQIRERAGVEPYATITADNMLAERGRELFAESKRRQDLIRFGRYNDPWWEKPATDPSKNIFPVPRQALDANPNLVQNPGY